MNKHFFLYSFKSLILLLLNILYFGIFAQDIIYSHEDLTVEKVPVEKINDYRNDNDFKYIHKNSPDNFWDIFWDFLKKALKSAFSNNGIAPYFRTVFYIMVITTVILLVRKADISSIFSKNKSISENRAEYLEETIYGVDFDKNISNAIIQNDYRLAVRFLYLKLLNILDSKNLIEWFPGKTNRKYLQELKNHTFYNDFKTLSKIYDYIWYGHFVPDKNTFDTFYSVFKQVFKRLK